MAAPAIRNLNSLVKDLGQSVAPQKKLIDADIAMNATAGKAQEEGLAATAQNTYGQIEQAAQDKGMFFSGFSPDEKAKYNSSTYLPALAQLQATIAGTRSQLLGKKADLDTNVFNKAFDTREGDVGRRFQFTERQEGQKFSADQAERGRQFEARENAATRAASAAQSRLSREAEPSAAQNMASALTAKTGGDGFVSPGTWQALKSQWTSGGYGDAKSFDNSFASYRNPKNKYYKLG